jgi:hypothetical protein
MAARVGRHTPDSPWGIPGGKARRPFGEHRSDDLGDDLAGSSDDDPIAGTHVLLPHLVLVVQRRGGDRDSPDEHRLEAGEWRRRPCGTDGHLDVEQRGHLLLGGQLVRDGPARCPGRGPELALVGEIVDLDDDAVEFVVEFVAASGVLVDVGDDAGDTVGDDAGVVVDRQSQIGEPVEGGVVRTERWAALDLAQLIGPERQVAAGSDGGVLLAERSCGGVAGVDVAALARRVGTAVELGEIREAQEDLAADLEHWWRIGDERRDGGDGGDVGGDVLAGAAVTAGGRPHETPVLVADRHGESVELQLAQPGADLGVLAQATLEAIGPLGDLVDAEGVVERHHRHCVHHGRKRDRGRPADGRRGRVGRDQVGVGRLEVAQLAHEGVPLGVGDLGGVALVIGLVVAADDRTQCLDALGRVDAHRPHDIGPL